VGRWGKGRRQMFWLKLREDGKRKTPQKEKKALQYPKFSYGHAKKNHLGTENRKTQKVLQPGRHPHMPEKPTCEKTHTAVMKGKKAQKNQGGKNTTQRDHPSLDPRTALTLNPR